MRLLSPLEKKTLFLSLYITFSNVSVVFKRMNENLSHHQVGGRVSQKEEIVNGETENSTAHLRNKQYSTDEIQNIAEQVK